MILVYVFSPLIAPPGAEDVKLLRVVVREDFSKSRCDLLIRDILAVVKTLDAQDAKTIQETRYVKNLALIYFVLPHKLKVLITFLFLRSHHHRNAKQRWALLRNIGALAFTKNHEKEGQLPAKHNGVC